MPFAPQEVEPDAIKPRFFDVSVGEHSEILVDDLLDGAGLTKEYKLMTRTVCGSRRKFDDIATALR